jgi:hypothetical protein
MSFFEFLYHFQWFREIKKILTKNSLINNCGYENIKITTVNTYIKWNIKFQ